MLVFTRKCQQSVVVEDCGGAAQMLTVTVLEIRGGRVRLGFEVADRIPAHRRELPTRIHVDRGADRPARGSAAQSA